METERNRPTDGGQFVVFPNFFTGALGRVLTGILGNWNSELDGENRESFRGLSAVSLFCFLRVSGTCSPPN